MRTTAVQLLKTFALVIVCASVLYLAANWIASSGDPQYLALWLALILSMGVGAFTMLSAVGALRTGELPSRTGSIYRSAEPFWYWTLLVLEYAAAAGLLALAVFCGWRLMSG